MTESEKHVEPQRNEEQELSTGQGRARAALEEVRPPPAHRGARR